MDMEEKKAVNKLRVLLTRCCGDTSNTLDYAAAMLLKKNLGRLSYIPGELRYISKSGETVKIADINLTEEELRKLEKPGSLLRKSS